MLNCSRNKLQIWSVKFGAGGAKWITVQATAAVYMTVRIYGNCERYIGNIMVYINKDNTCVNANQSEMKHFGSGIIFVEIYGILRCLHKKQ